MDTQNNETQVKESFIDYGMTKDYRSSWGVVDAIRELVQNCLDNHECESSFEVNRETGEISIFTDGFILPTKTLAMGMSEKPDGAIGGFGEGMKLAMMILQREGCSPVMNTGNNEIYADFVHNDVMDVETFRLCISTHDEDGVNYTDGLEFIIKVESADDDFFNDLIHKVDAFSDNPMPTPERFSIDLIDDRPGDIYVNGLFVCHDDKFRYGYNFSPEMLTIGCDRQVASSTGMAWETSRFWADKICNENKDEILNMLTEEVLDVSDIQYHITESKAKLITDAFVERFGHVTIKPMGSSLSYGMGLTGSLYSTVSKSGYAKVANPWNEEGHPHKELQDFVDKHHVSINKLVGKTMRSELLELVEKSKNWQRK